MSDVGIYVHVPFCLTRCGYCDFNAYAGLDHLAPRYVRALLAEAGLAAPAWADDEVVSIFFGGGTPTTLDVADLKGVLTHVRDRFTVRDDAEVSIEANPDTVDTRSSKGCSPPGSTGCRWARSRSTAACSSRSSACTRPTACDGRSSPPAPPATRT